LSTDDNQVKNSRFFGVYDLFLLFSA